MVWVVGCFFCDLACCLLWEGSVGKGEGLIVLVGVLCLAAHSAVSELQVEIG